MRVLVSGATGFIGSRLAAAFARNGDEVRCLVRDPVRAARLAPPEAELHVGDVLDEKSLAGAGRGAEVAYYLIHSMGRGGGPGFAARERVAAENFARMARREGVERVVYLGGLGNEPRSEHLRSRHETARTLAWEGPPLTYFRAAMVVGAESEGYKLLRHLVKRLPVMITPAWLRTRTQPIGVDDVVRFLRDAARIPASAGREIEIGGPDVLRYEDMLDRMAEALGVRPRPKVPVPLLTPRLSALWIGLVTPVDVEVARPLVEGLSTETVVTDPSGGALFAIAPQPFALTLRRALEEEEGAAGVPIAPPAAAGGG